MTLALEGIAAHQRRRAPRGDLQALHAQGETWRTIGGQALLTKLVNRNLERETPGAGWKDKLYGDRGLLLAEGVLSGWGRFVRDARRREMGSGPLLWKGGGSVSYDPSRFDRRYFLQRSIEGMERHLAYRRAMAQALVRVLGPRRVLDVGAGTGLLVQAFLEENVEAVGLEVSPEALELSPVRDHLLRFDATKDPIPIPENSVDLVTLVEFVEHIPTLSNLLPEIHRVLRKDGAVFQQTPLPGTSEARADPTHIRVLPRREWVREYRSYGFRPDILTMLRLDREIPPGVRGQRLPLGVRRSLPVRLFVTLTGTRTIFRKV